MTSPKTHYLSRQQPPQMTDVSGEVLRYDENGIKEVLAGKVKKLQIYQIYDIAHNVAKIEEHESDGRRLKVCMHRKVAVIKG